MAFYPPASPHFGGIWEAGVKTVKQHLRRVIGETNLTFEEIETLFCQIEACMNSRPLYAMSGDAHDLSALTPAHLIIGESLLNVPEPNLLNTKPTLLQRWKLIEQMNQRFWKRWSSD